MTQPLILVVPGGFIKPAAYDKLADELSHLGYTVVVPSLTVYGDLSNETPDSQAWKDLAEKGVPDDVKMLHSHMLSAFEKGYEIVIMGHSYGSLPATLSVENHTVAERHARGEKGGIKAFVNLAGFAYSDRGKNILGGDEDMPPMPYHVLEAGILRLKEDVKTLFFSDVSAEQQDKAWKAGVQVTQSNKSLQHRPEYLASDMKLPKYYIRLTKDVVVSPDFQAAFVMKGHFSDEFELASGHCPFESQPRELANILDTIAKR